MNNFLRTALSEHCKALYNEDSDKSVFYKNRKNALKRERRNPEKKDEPVADIDRKQAPGGDGEIRTHVPLRTT